MDTIRALSSLGGDTEFYVDILATIMRCGLSIIIAFALGCLVAYGSYSKQWLRSFFSLPVAFFKAVPVMAIIIYLILLANSAVVPIIVAFLMCFPIVYTNVLTGLDSIDSKLLEMGSVFNLSRRKTMRFITIPSVLPQIKASLSLIAGLSWKAVVTAEVLSIPKFSLGYKMMDAKYYLETPNLFAYILVIVCLSIAFERLIKKAVNTIDIKSYQKSKTVKYADTYTNKEAKAVENTVKSPKDDIKVRNFTKTFEDGKTVVFPDRIFEKGRTSVIMAPSGTGKTTLLRAIAGLTEYGGQITGFKDQADGVAMIFQENRLIPWLNVYDNLAIVMQGLTKDEIKEKVLPIIEGLSLTDAMYKLPHELSGGMQHRVAIGRALIFPSGLLLVDEPFRGLDEELKLAIIHGIWKEKTAGKTIIVATHNPGDEKELLKEY